MNTERMVSFGIPEDRQGHIRSWGEMQIYIKEFTGNEVNPSVRRFIRGYFVAQKLISENKSTKAARLFEGLEKQIGFLEFEENNPFLLRIIDIAVKGKTYQYDY